MPLQAYVTAHLGPSVWLSLQPWYDALGASDDLRLIRRNIDRECDRNDINPRTWLDFLVDVSGSHAGPDSLQTIDAVLKRRPSHFALAGRALPAPSNLETVFRLARLDDFHKYMLSPLPIVPSSYGSLANDINAGKITGANLDSKQFGRNDRPTWCTLSRPPMWRANADRARDRFGLKHIDTGYLVEMEYPISFVKSVVGDLKAPTVLDSWAGGASNWIFAKRRGIGGPDWGYTVDMDGGGACGRGSTEAVHAAFTVPAGQGYYIGLNVHGPIANSSPAVNFNKLLLNVAI